jgi:hypothetical protein
MALACTTPYTNSEFGRDDDPELPAVLVFQRFPGFAAAGAASAPLVLAIVLRLRGERQYGERAVAGPRRKATPQDNLVALGGSDLIAAPNEGIEHHPSGMRVVILRGGNESAGMGRRAVRPFVSSNHMLLRQGSFVQTLYSETI